MAQSLISLMLSVKLPRTLQVLEMTKGEKQAMTIQVAKRPQLFLFLFQSFFLSECLCALAYLVSFTK